MITIAVPPALPACLTIATVFSIDRLRKGGVFVTSPDRITMAGRLDVICFDKTGACVCVRVCGGWGGGGWGEVAGGGHCKLTNA